MLPVYTFVAAGPRCGFQEGKTLGHRKIIYGYRCFGRLKFVHSVGSWEPRYRLFPVKVRKFRDILRPGRTPYLVVELSYGGHICSLLVPDQKKECRMMVGFGAILGGRRWPVPAKVRIIAAFCRTQRPREVPDTVFSREYMSVPVRVYDRRYTQTVSASGFDNDVRTRATRICNHCQRVSVIPRGMALNRWYVRCLSKARYGMEDWCIAAAMRYRLLRALGVNFNN